MVPLRLLKDGSIYDLKKDEFYECIADMCSKQRKDNRALAFAFILYDLENPQIFKILKDSDYWNALNSISGNFLSIFYIHTRETTFGEDLAKISSYEQRSMHPIETDRKLSVVLPMLKKYLELNEEVQLPSILFFQVEDTCISDYFLIKLYEENIEEGFNELKNYILSARTGLRMIDPDNFNNTELIFKSLKNGVNPERFKQVFFKHVQKFPVKILISWIIGKV